ncbi:MAG: ATP phosphoribosyltransferase regulatory subunit [Rhizobiales bacterium]|nr:ATP phosphoribosyltransferase regulatory subunit [Hyphomicrobiales bacterium]
MTAVQLPDFADELVAAMAARDTERAEIPVIQPAEPFLDMAGEDLRRRIYLTENENGDSLCLRPEFTIPVCLGHIAGQVGTPRRYSYLGQVFRQRRVGGNEFYQAGIEDLGEADIAKADARAISDAAGLLRELLPSEYLSVTIGDQALFEAVVAGLGLPAGWQKRLIHAFGDETAMGRMIESLASAQAATVEESDLGELIVAGDVSAIAAHIGSVMEETGYSTHASRSPEEIAARLVEKTELEKTRLSDKAFAALKTFLALDARLSEAVAELRRFASSADLEIGSALNLFAARVEGIEASGADLPVMRWRAAFGRPLDYYTGLVFEIASTLEGAVLAGGGRYDRMMTLLGAREEIPAVGFSLWVDRIEALRTASGAGEPGE